jgi:aminoglycoside phosphotransferase (APT) family kinase protein
VAEADEVGAKLRALLRDRGIVATVAVHRRAAGGLSQDSWLVDVTVGDEVVDAVLRLPTPASGTRAILRQRRALDAVAGELPAPRVRWHDDGEDNPFAAPFFAMDRVAGTVPFAWDVLPEPARSVLAEHAMDVLAALHAVAPERLGAADASVPATATELGWYRHRFSRMGDLPPVVRLALWWLERHDPGPPERRTIVHGDYRMGNFVVEGERISAVLDWEMTAVGDPLADLVWCFIPVWTSSGLDEPGLMRRYAAAAGIELKPTRLQWQLVLAHLRLVYYAMAGAGAFASGASQDLRLAAFGLHLPIRLDRLAAALDGDLEGAVR